MNVTRILTIVCICVGSAAFSVDARACAGSTSLFHDDFKSLGAAWPSGNGDMKVADGHLFLSVGPQATPDQVWGERSLNQTDVYQDATVCATIAFDKIANPDSTYAGVAFWAVDDSHYYGLVITPNGSYEVLRKVADGRFLTPVPWTASTAIKTQPGQKQELQVVMKGNTASLYINGTKIGDVTGQPPASGSLMGLYWAMPGKDMGAIVEVDAFDVKS